MKFLKAPWWVSATLAVCAYVLLKYFAPDFFAPNISNFLAFLAPIVTMGLLLHSATMLYEGDEKPEEDDSPKSPER